MIVAIVGATGTGKSALSLDLAEALASQGGAEVVNADAMQLYAGMDIGTAKLPVAERRGVPHVMFDVLDPATDDASVSDYQRDARHEIERIERHGATPLLVGGSGLYVSSVLNDFQFPGTDEAIRAALEALAESEGPGILFAELQGKDPVAAQGIGPHNVRRIIRALEVIELTGEPFGAGLPDEHAFWRPTVVIGLACDREKLKPRLDERVEAMWRDGIVDEARGLGQLSTTAARAIGYAQALAQLRGELTEREAIEQAQALTRRYARRQVSWFRRYPAITWLDADDPALLDRALAALG
jgi:tRNA dimethylallyltransferase